MSAAVANDVADAGVESSFRCAAVENQGRGPVVVGPKAVFYSWAEPLTAALFFARAYRGNAKLRMGEFTRNA